MRILQAVLACALVATASWAIAADEPAAIADKAEVKPVAAAKPAAPAAAKPAAPAPAEPVEVKPVEPVKAAPAMPAGLETLDQQISYLVGVNTGMQLAQMPIASDIKALVMGIADALARRNPQLSRQQVTEISQAFAKRIEAKEQAAAAASEQYLAENAKKEGVKTTDSGLQYRVIQQGKGDNAKLTDTVLVHYVGKHTNGTVFDASRKHGEKPTEFNLAQPMIPGWKEGMELMNPGSKYEFVIPGHLGYGPRGDGSSIGPNETLIFEVELVSIVAPEAKAAP